MSGPWSLTMKRHERAITPRPPGSALGHTVVAPPPATAPAGSQSVDANTSQHATLSMRSRRFRDEELGRQSTSRVRRWFMDKWMAVAPQDTVPLRAGRLVTPSVHGPALPTTALSVKQYSALQEICSVAFLSCLKQMEHVRPDQAEVMALVWHRMIDVLQHQHQHAVQSEALVAENSLQQTVKQLTQARKRDAREMARDIAVLSTHSQTLQVRLANKDDTITELQRRLDMATLDQFRQARHVRKQGDHVSLEYRIKKLREELAEVHEHKRESDRRCGILDREIVSRSRAMDRMRDEVVRMRRINESLLEDRRRMALPKVDVAVQTLASVDEVVRALGNASMNSPLVDAAVFAAQHGSDTTVPTVEDEDLFSIIQDLYARRAAMSAGAGAGVADSFPRFAFRQFLVDPRCATVDEAGDLFASVLRSVRAAHWLQNSRVIAFRFFLEWEVSSVIPAPVLSRSLRFYLQLLYLLQRQVQVLGGRRASSSSAGPRQTVSSPHERWLTLQSLDRLCDVVLPKVSKPTRRFLRAQLKDKAQELLGSPLCAQSILSAQQSLDEPSPSKGRPKRHSHAAAAAAASRTDFIDLDAALLVLLYVFVLEELRLARDTQQLTAQLLDEESALVPLAQFHEVLAGHDAAPSDWTQVRSAAVYQILSDLQRLEEPLSPALIALVCQQEGFPQVHVEIPLSIPTDDANTSPEVARRGSLVRSQRRGSQAADTSQVPPDSTTAVMHIIAAEQIKFDRSLRSSDEKWRRKLEEVGVAHKKHVEAMATQHSQQVSALREHFDQQLTEEVRRKDHEVHVARAELKNLMDTHQTVLRRAQEDRARMKRARDHAVFQLEQKLQNAEKRAQAEQARLEHMVRMLRTRLQITHGEVYEQLERVESERDELSRQVQVQQRTPGRQTQPLPQQPP